MLAFDPASGRLRIDYDRYPAAVGDLLREVIALQEAGDPARAAPFIDRWGGWNDKLHGRIAAASRPGATGYGALGE